MKLYIIGNGFDIAHNIQSSYSNFCTFMRDHHPNDYERIGRLFFDDESVLWSDFERNLTHLNIVRLVSEKIATWKYQNSRDIENTFDTEFSNLKTFFMEWVISEFNDIHTDRIYDLSVADFYINFNYTNTLHTVYGIPNTNILYIHGNSVDNPLQMPIVGHGESPEEIAERIAKTRGTVDAIVRTSLLDAPGLYPFEETIEVITLEIGNFLNSLRKNTADIIQNYHEFFENLSAMKDEISDVIVLGHSLADVDLPYFRKIDASLDVDTRWHTDYFPHDDTSKQAKQQRFKELMGFEVLAYERE